MTLEQQIAQFIASGLVNGAIYALIGLGLVIIHSVTRVVNVAQGEFAALGALLTATLVARGLPYWLSILIAVIVTGGVGAGVHRMAIRPARAATPLVLLIITIAAHLTLRGVFLILWGTEPYNLPAFSAGPPLRIAGAVLNRQSLWVFAAVGLILTAAYLFFTRTIQGRALRACAVNATAARLYGMNVELLGLQSFAISGALGGIAGVLITPLTLATYDMGLILGLKGFVGAVVVGFASYPWTVAACLTFGVVESLGAGLISSGYRDAIAFGVLVVVLLWRALAAAREGVLVSEERAQE
ncbi:MAG: branched-chain amino acid ABC transporter permease [Armatimonadota bacterium]